MKEADISLRTVMRFQPWRHRLRVGGGRENHVCPFAVVAADQSRSEEMKKHPRGRANQRPEWWAKARSENGSAQESKGKGDRRHKRGE